MVCQKNQEELLKKRLEVADEVINKNNELMKRWNKRLTADNSRFIDRFLAGELQIFFRLGLGESGEEWICYLEQVSALKPISCEQVVAPNGEKKAMLINVIKLLEEPERIIPALVWLEPINRFLSILPHSVYFSSLSGFIYLGAKADREGNVVARLPIGSPHLCEMVSQMVEGTPKILDDISSGGEHSEARDRERAMIWTHLASLRVSLHAKYIQVLTGSGGDFGLQFREVFLGPFDLYPDKCKPTFGV